MFNAIFLPALSGRPDKSRGGFATEEAAWEYVYATMCQYCRDERARVLAGTATGHDDLDPPCSDQWVVEPSETPPC